METNRTKVTLTMRGGQTLSEVMAVEDAEALRERLADYWNGHAQESGAEWLGAHGPLVRASAIDSIDLGRKGGVVF